MRKTSLAEMSCPIARTLDVVGEWWTLVIVRDAFLGARRFDEFKSSGIADNILAARLKRLVEQGVFERHLYQERPERHEYPLTDKGRDLLLVLGALATWGLKWNPGGKLNRMRHVACGEPATVRGYCEHCGELLEAKDVEVQQIPRERLVKVLQQVADGTFAGAAAPA
jgi:DNA-binding HxlR family transcriptional regulator